MSTRRSGFTRRNSARRLSSRSVRRATNTSVPASGAKLAGNLPADASRSARDERRAFKEIFHKNSRSSEGNTHRPGDARGRGSAILNCPFQSATLEFAATDGFSHRPFFAMKLPCLVASWPPFLPAHACWPCSSVACPVLHAQLRPAGDHRGSIRRPALSAVRPVERHLWPRGIFRHFQLHPPLHRGDRRTPPVRSPRVASP